MSQRIIDLRKKNSQPPTPAPLSRIVSRRTRVKKTPALPVMLTATQSSQPTSQIKKPDSAISAHTASAEALYITPHEMEPIQTFTSLPLSVAAPMSMETEKLIIAPVAPLAPPAPVRQEPVKDALSASAIAEKPEGNTDNLQWTSYEHEHRIHGPYWFIYPLSIATFAMVFGIITHSYLFVLLVAISFAILLYYAYHVPRLLTYRIENRGIWIEKKCVAFNQIKSFWIYTHPLLTPELLLETHHPLNHIMHIRLEHINTDRVRTVLLQYLKEVEQKDRISDQIARMIGF